MTWSIDWDNPWRVVDEETMASRSRCEHGFGAEVQGDEAAWCMAPSNTAEGYCPKHLRWLKRGDDVRHYAPRASTCKLEVCVKRVHARGLCSRHYRRQARGAQLITLREQRIWDMEGGI